MEPALSYAQKLKKHIEDFKAAAQNNQTGAALTSMENFSNMFSMEKLQSHPSETAKEIRGNEGVQFVGDAIDLATQKNPSLSQMRAMLKLANEFSKTNSQPAMQFAMLSLSEEKQSHITKDSAFIMEWFTKANNAQTSSPEHKAQSSLALYIMHAHGLGTEINMEKAIRYRDMLHQTLSPDTLEDIEIWMEDAELYSTAMEDESCIIDREKSTGTLTLDMHDFMGNVQTLKHTAGAQPEYVRPTPAQEDRQYSSTMGKIRAAQELARAIKIS